MALFSQISNSYFEKMFCKLSLLFIILITTTTIAQNNLFEKVYQKGSTDLEHKLL